ncbi:MAG TPA: DUF1816 domain-containing protein [Candidatus Obscuribacterales bacterium]
MSDIWLSMLEFLGQAWWAEVITDNPRCTYYFGPFASSSEAESAKAGYVADLRQEGATNIRVTIKRCKPDPKDLTLYEGADEDDAALQVGGLPIFSS